MNWGADNGVRWNDTFDGFVHGLRAVHAYLGKGKEKDADLRLVVVVERAERLIPEFMVPLTRLAELVAIVTGAVNLHLAGPSPPLHRICLRSPRKTIRPPLGASPDPYFFDIPPPTKEGMSSRKYLFKVLIPSP